MTNGRDGCAITANECFIRVFGCQRYAVFSVLRGGASSLPRVGDQVCNARSIDDEMQKPEDRHRRSSLCARPSDVYTNHAAIELVRGRHRNYSEVHSRRSLVGSELASEEWGRSAVIHNVEISHITEKLAVNRLGKERVRWPSAFKNGLVTFSSRYGINSSSEESL